MSLYIRLNKEINPQQLLQKIQHEVNEYKKSNSLEDSILCIDIKPTAYIVDNLVKQEVSAYLEEK